MPVDSLRLWAAAGIMLVYIVMCAAIHLAQRRKRQGAAAPALHEKSPAAWIVAFASQTGTAEELAAHTVATLRLAGVPARLCSLSDLDVGTLAEAERILFLVSTYGEGDPPDNAALFASRLVSFKMSLAGLHYAVLALGDSSYANFCGFGRTLDRMLQERGAQPMFDRIDVDRSDADTIQAWRHRLSHLAGTSDLPDWSGPQFSNWILVERRHLNPGSAGDPVFHLELAPAAAELPDWQSGDLAQVLIPDDPDRPREYSIASIPSDGRVHLLVRKHRRPDGSTGAASRWLTRNAVVGEVIQMRLRQHRRFRLEDNSARPLILIGNGTGIAGLRSHLRARATNGAGPTWLIFGERNVDCDFHYREEICTWKENGILQRIDLAFSRDQAERRYVQDSLAESSEMLHSWIASGAAIYVCGSLKGMAGSVDTTLATILGHGTLDSLSAEGRYRRDVY